ncbi:MAG: hypothetical protein IT580_02785, partial [Verrucomicrobiales bacterium]|nr:hypothetical protein [Verrucomicrobiales bacterium]
LDGLQLSTGEEESSVWVLSESETLAPGATKVLQPREWGRVEGVAPSEFHPALHPGGGVLLLRESAARGGGVMDAVEWGPQLPGYSVARQGTTTGRWGLAWPTPSATNQLVPTSAPKPLRLNEWMAAPSRGEDWLELINPSDGVVSLEGVGISDDRLNPFRFAFPPLSFLGTGKHAYLVLLAERAAAAGVALGFGLSQAGETLGLRQVDRELDATSFGPQQAGISEGRIPDGDGTAVARRGRATPGTSNAWGQGADDNANGVPDAWERNYGWGPPGNAADMAGDADGDRFNNLSEWQAGTDPTDAGSGLRLRVRPRAVSGTIPPLAPFEAWIPAARAAVVERRVRGWDDQAAGWSEFVRLAPAHAPGWRAWTQIPAGGEAEFYRIRLEEP